MSNVQRLLSCKGDRGPPAVAAVLLAAAFALMLPGQAWATSVFYYGVGSSNTGDDAWNAAVGSFTAFNFDAIPAGTNLSSLTAGSVTVGLGLAGNGTAGTVEVYHSTAFAGAGGVSDTVYDGAILNRSAAKSYPRMTFTFSSPVKGFGAWVFDNNAASRESFELVVTDASGTVTSLVLESHPSPEADLNHSVEGFLGAISNTGITSAYIVMLDRDTLVEPTNRYFEVDNVKVGPALQAQSDPIPEPLTAAGMVLGIGGLVTYVRKRRAA